MSLYGTIVFHLTEEGLLLTKDGASVILCLVLISLLYVHLLQLIGIIGLKFCKWLSPKIKNLIGRIKNKK